VTSSLREARRLRRALVDHLLAGERGGLPPRDFDLGNSPLQLLSADLQGRGLILTGSGWVSVVPEGRPVAIR